MYANESSTRQDYRLIDIGGTILGEVNIEMYQSRKFSRRMYRSMDNNIMISITIYYYTYNTQYNS